VGDTLPNELPTLLREWFGPDAGLPGTSFEVEFHRDGDAWQVAAVDRSRNSQVLGPMLGGPAE
jgi:hypothetical protein